MKLPPPSESPKRIYEIAQELGIESKRVVAWLRDNGEFVRSASTTANARVERKIREAFPASARPTPTAEEAVRAERPPRPTTEDAWDRALRDAHGVAAGTRRPKGDGTHAARGESPSTFVRYVLERYDGLSVASASRVAAEWARQLFAPEDAMAWMTAGAEYGDAVIAAALSAEGVTPTLACSDVLPCGAGRCRRAHHSPIGRVRAGDMTVLDVRTELERRGMLPPEEGESR